MFLKNWKLPFSFLYPTPLVCRSQQSKSSSTRTTCQFQFPRRCGFQRFGSTCVFTPPLQSRHLGSANLLPAALPLTSRPGHHEEFLAALAPRPRRRFAPRRRRVVSLSRTRIMRRRRQLRGQQHLRSQPPPSGGRPPGRGCRLAPPLRVPCLGVLA